MKKPENKKPETFVDPKWPALLECYRSGQVSEKQWQEHLQEPAFAAWLAETIMTKKKSSVIAYKGFDQNMKCRGFQYEVGKTYKYKYDVVVCESGFHSYLFPFDVFRYYAPANAKFALVELSGDQKTHKKDTKIAAATNTGDWSAASVEGKQSTAIATGVKGRVMASQDGCSLFCNEWVEKDDSWFLIDNASGITGKDGIKAGVWYTAKNGKLVPVEGD